MNSTCAQTLGEDIGIRCLVNTSLEAVVFFLLQKSDVLGAAGWKNSPMYDGYCIFGISDQTWHAGSSCDGGGGAGRPKNCVQVPSVGGFPGKASTKCECGPQVRGVSQKRMLCSFSQVSSGHHPIRVPWRDRILPNRKFAECDVSITCPNP